MRTGHQILSLEFEGKNLKGLEDEAGGHRIQRVPPTERRGRTHTSTITVAVISGREAAETAKYKKREDDDFQVEWYNGTIKAGGQHHNKHANCCRLTHLPTGIVKTAQTRSRENSENLARAALSEELDRMIEQGNHSAQNNVRKEQVGSGMRGDKRRTLRWQDDTAVDHITGKRARTSDIMKGQFNLLWN